MNGHLICGDIGGTKTLLRAVKVQNGAIGSHFEQRYDSKAHDDFDAILRDFIKQANCHPDTICLAVAGPVIAQQVNPTNLPWTINAHDIAEQFSIASVRIINDFEATALSVDALATDDLITLQSVEAASSPMRVVLGAGTGMGVAWLVRHGRNSEPIATEAGHISYAPTSAEQIALLQYLMTKHQRVSIERLLSGQGLTQIFNFLQSNMTSDPHLRSIELDSDDGATVTRLAFEHQHPIAQRALDLFAEIYGAYAGDLALTGLCRGGVYIAGGIAPRIIRVLKQPGFIRAFRNKGRFSPLMYQIPIHVITNPKAPLQGAELMASRMLQQQAIPRIVE